jgi:hypothetical protein
MTSEPSTFNTELVLAGSKCDYLKIQILKNFLANE